MTAPTRNSPDKTAEETPDHDERNRAQAEFLMAAVRRTRHAEHIERLRRDRERAQDSPKPAPD